MTAIGSGRRRSRSSGPVADSRALSSGVVHHIDFAADREAARLAAAEADAASRHCGPIMVGDRIWVVDGSDIVRTSLQER
jgi:hypothetical protein